MGEVTPETISKRRVLHRMEGMEALSVRRDAYRTGGAGPLAMDLYRPASLPAGGRRPAVILVAGYPDPGMRQRLGCSFKDMGSTVSWAQLIAASGLVAIAYENRQPAADLRALAAHVAENAPALGIDAERLGIWASSGNAPAALSMLMEDADAAIRCAALFYGYTLDLGGSTSVANASRMFGFANPCAGRSVEDFRKGTALFLARAGRDECPGLNETLDRFAAEALRVNLPLTIVNHPEGPHAFDLVDGGERTQEIVRRALGFLRFNLLAPEGGQP